MGGDAGGLLGCRLPAARPGRPLRRGALRLQVLAPSFHGSRMLEGAQLSSPRLPPLEQLRQAVHGAARPAQLLLLGIHEGGSRPEPRIRGGAQVSSRVRRISSRPGLCFDQVSGFSFSSLPISFSPSLSRLESVSWQVSKIKDSFFA